MASLDSRRRAYLDAMGIDVWVPAQPVNQPEAETRPVAVEQQAESPLAAVSENVSSPVVAEHISQPVSSIDVSSLDMVALREQVATCQLCALSQTRTQAVFGVGNEQADILVIGEAPGADEDEQGEPFVGRAGQLLNAMLKAIRLERGEVYIANVLKCRPPQNRDPSDEEAEQCWPYLKRQVELVKPKVILALGKVAAHRLLKTNSTLSRLRGKLHYLEDMPVPVIVTYHPAYLLRSPQEKRKAWEDLQFLTAQLDELS